MIDDEVIMISDSIINETEEGLQCYGVEAVNVKTGEVKFAFFANYKLPIGKHDNGVIRIDHYEEIDPVKAAFERYPVTEYSVTFHGLAWARQNKMCSIMENLEKKKETLARYESLAASACNEEEKERYVRYADMIFRLQHEYMEYAAKNYERFCGYKITYSHALHSVYRGEIDYSLISG